MAQQILSVKIPDAQNKENAGEGRIGQARFERVFDEAQAARKLAWKEGSNCDPYAEGFDACERGLGRGDNPFSTGSTPFHLWDKGFVARGDQ